MRLTRSLGMWHDVITFAGGKRAAIDIIYFGFALRGESNAHLMAGA